MKRLLSGVAVAAILAITAPIWAQSPSTPPDATPQSSTSSAAPPSTTPTPAPAPAASDKASPEKPSASNWVQPRPHRHTHRVRRYARYGYHPYYGYYRWVSPTDHMARQLNAQQLYGGGWGWGGGPYDRNQNSPD